MKVLIINGSPRLNGNTTRAINELVKIFDENNVETEVIKIGNKDIRGCIACNKCFEKGKCVFDDVVNETAVKLKDADGIIIASPVYYASANATLVAFMQRLFYSTFTNPDLFRLKPAETKNIATAPTYTILCINSIGCNMCIRIMESIPTPFNASSHTRRCINTIFLP